MTVAVAAIIDDEAMKKNRKDIIDDFDILLLVRRKRGSVDG